MILGCGLPLLRAGLLTMPVYLACLVAAGAAPAPNGDSVAAATHAAADPIQLSAQAEQVAQIAIANGDKTFLMIDKARGVILLFEDGKATYGGPALTGAAMGDRVPPKVLTFTGMHPLTLEQKVTPAGRFTVHPEYDPDYGRVWTLNEIHGKDWDFAIHQVFLGIPSEHRDSRIRSTDPADHHITFGCINIERSAVQYLTRALPKTGNIPLYILPQDASLTADLFPLRNQRSASSTR